MPATNDGSIKVRKMAGYKNNSFSQTEAAVEVTDELVTARDKVKTKTAVVGPNARAKSA